MLLDSEGPFYLILHCFFSLERCSLKMLTYNRILSRIFCCEPRRLNGVSVEINISEEGSTCFGKHEAVKTGA